MLYSPLDGLETIYIYMYVYCFTRRSFGVKGTGNATDNITPNCKSLIGKARSNCQKCDAQNFTGSPCG